MTAMALRCSSTQYFKLHLETALLMRGLFLAGDSMAITYRGESFEGYNKPKRTPKHPDKSHAVLAKQGDKVRLIRFGQQGADNKPPRKGESEADKAKRRSFKARFAKQIAAGRKDKTASAAYWADKVKW
jgi:hypothetical protein